MTIEDIVEMLRTDAATAASSPLGQLVLSAARRLEHGGDMPVGARRRLSSEQAFAAMTVCTRMVRTHGLQPSTVCKEAGLVEEASGTFRYMLTAREMTPIGELVQGAAARRDISKKLQRYVQIVRTVARLAGKEELPLLEDLGVAVADYLAPFNEETSAPHDELAADLIALGTYFGRAREGTGGELIDLKEFFEASGRMGVIYDPATNGMVALPDDPVDLGHEPSVRLFMRRVASGQGECYRHERNPSGFPVYISREIGRVRFQVYEVVSLALVRNRDKIRAVLVAEPWTMVQDRPGEPPARFFDRSARRWEQGVPFGGGIRVGEGEGQFSLMAGTNVAFACPLYEQYIRELEGDGESEFGSGLVAEVVCTPRRIEIDPEVLRVYLEDVAAYEPRKALEFMEASAPWAQGYVVQATLTHADGREANSLLERLEDALYGDGNAILAALLDQVTKRVRALDDLMAKTLTTRQAQKTHFRRLMRS
ncbi:conserved protein of unknown function (plasmid) [Rhodovastum atsumiense]|uniref:Uncharacterized protein n=1 Tax=Rhodovastum atsumiense TaxID=504468 RepID=A0A5M6IV83_9PROT|nr:hypothetical protein [Rhodovastum atsumiense]KAA5611849.1 hypothetical protein F1189_12500 [Rhodovastum atsumiense]CAH2606178.1 conserved protein of unknown function [Rhodovastum atsumiense]